MTADLREAKERTAAAKLCSTSFYAALTSAGMFIFSSLGSAAAAVFAVVTGVLGLLRLTAVGMGPELTPDLKGLERVSVRMARRAKPQAQTGIGVGALVIAIAAFVMWAAHTQAENRRDRMQEALRGIEALNLDGQGPELTPEQAVQESLAKREFDAVAGRTRRPGFRPANAMTEDEVAEGLQYVLKRYPDTRVVRKLEGDPREPYVTMRRILTERGWKPPAEAAGD